MKKTILFCMLIAISAMGFSQIRIGNVVLPYKLSFEGEELTLNGAGMRSVLSVDTYSGGLYTQNKYNDPKEVLDSDESMAIRLNIVSKRVTNKRMTKVFKKGFDDAMYGNTETLQTRIDEFLKIFGAAINVNDFFDFVYIKGGNLKTYKNGEFIGEIKGRDFKYALFKIWLGDEPACALIKNGMLGIQK
ncbi:chalcone isomerase family protein [Aquimarina rhabdastrellae]